MSNSIGLGTTAEFIANEFSSLALNDKRLNKRAKSILSTLQRSLGSCIRRLFTAAQEARQAYDFFSNPKVSITRLIAPHYKQTVQGVGKS